MKSASNVFVCLAVLGNVDPTKRSRFLTTGLPAVRHVVWPQSAAQWLLLVYTTTTSILDKRLVSRSRRTSGPKMADRTSAAGKSPAALAQEYQSRRQELQSLAQKLGELEADADEHR